jgi:hypothetical protein
MVLAAGCAIEVLDGSGHIGVLFMTDPASQSIQIITARDDPEVARRYAAATRTEFSTVLCPPLEKLSASAPIPSSTH